ncbi:ABC transporter [Halobiforma lacisalsi AJ5]|uniref:ABC transporter n=1 Tax=Natronobacterium lacisalsi AJ5 TaxID=358396 RepID=M0LAC9_NATLA|nr:ABC transporter [Halobiforma lacisalsi AJ5]
MPPYARLTAREHLEFVADCKGVEEDIDELLADIGLVPAADRKVGEFSKGMTQRLRLGMALVGDPDVLILDEPSSGLDPTGISEMRELLRERAAAGATVFFSSHILSEVEELCDRIGILNDGQLVAVDTIDELRAVAAPETTLSIVVGNADCDPLDVLAAHEAVSDVWKDDDRFCASVDRGEKASVLAALENDGITVDDFSVDEASLEDLFTAYMDGNRRAREVES